MLARFGNHCKRSQVVSSDVARSPLYRPALRIFRAEKRANLQAPDSCAARAGSRIVRRPGPDGGERDLWPSESKAGHPLVSVWPSPVASPAATVELFSIK